MKTTYLIPFAFLFVIGCTDANVNDPIDSTTATEEMDRHEVARPILDEPSVTTDRATGVTAPNDSLDQPANLQDDPAASSSLEQGGTAPLGENEPLGQNDSQSAIDAAVNIRNQIAQADLSVSAQNIEIMNQDGQVTLNGEVANQAEKDRIEEIATEVAGAGQVTNNLEISEQ